MSQESWISEKSASTLAVRIEFPELGAVRVVGVHPRRPRGGADLWRTDQDQLFDFISDSDWGLPTIVAGDFNAVDDHAPMRRLHDAGYVCAVDIVGAGWTPTYPAVGSVPPMIGIDHILITDTLTATAASSVRVEGTDHLGLLAEIAAIAN